MGTGIAGRQVCLFAMVHRHTLAIGHLTIIVQGMAVCRRSHQRTAQIATCRQRLNADQKQQYCCEEDLLRHLPLSFANDSNACSVSNSPTHFSVDFDGSTVCFGDTKCRMRSLESPERVVADTISPLRIALAFGPIKEKYPLPAPLKRKRLERPERISAGRSLPQRPPSNQARCRASRRQAWLRGECTGTCVTLWT
jgi:hypothetical protein